jgi:hypothetical protein
MNKNLLLAGVFTVALAGGTLTTATAAETTAPASRIKISGHVEAGITANFNDPDDHQNFGRLFDDRANEPMLNQFVVTAEQALDPKATGFDWGFKIQGMYGSDARFIHSTGLLDRTTHQILQPELVEAYLNTHFAVDGTAGGVDVKWGKFVTLEGAETIDSTTNIFYSHTYLFNFGIPLNHTGALATIHATKDLDIFAGVTQGVNTFKDNNGKLAFHGGFALPNLAGGKVTLAVTTHIGPETPHNNKDYRYLNDAVLVWKIDDKLTSITDINYIQDDGPKPEAKGYGVAQYFTYAIDKAWQANFRGEVWRDNNGFFVAQIGNNTDLLRFERGDSFTPDARTVGGGVTTYGALTAGLTWKASDTLAIRPELRYDRSLNDTKPFNDSRHKDMFTAAVDVTWSF